jgi:hypothetical protein
LFIENTEFFVAEIVTIYAALAALAVVAKVGIDHPSALVQIGTKLGVFCVGAKVASFAFFDRETVGTVLAVQAIITAIQKVFAVSGVHAHVAIFVVRGVVCVEGIFAVHVYDAGAGSCCC